MAELHCKRIAVGTYRGRDSRGVVVADVEA